MCSGPCGPRLFIVIVQKQSGPCAVHYSLQGAQHYALLVAEVECRHIHGPDDGGRWQEHGEQSVIGPAHLVIFQYPVSTGVEVVKGIHEGDILHLGHVCLIDISVGGMHVHGISLYIEEGHLVYLSHSGKRTGAIRLLHSHGFLLCIASLHAQSHCQQGKVAVFHILWIEYFVIRVMILILSVSLFSDLHSKVSNYF